MLQIGNGNTESEITYSSFMLALIESLNDKLFTQEIQIS